MAHEGASPQKSTRQHWRVGGIESQTLSGNVTLTYADAQSQKMDANGSSRNITLPDIDGANGAWFEFYNASSTSVNLAIKNPAGSTILTVSKGQTGKVGCDGSSWFVIGSFPAVATDFGSGGITTDAIAESTAGAGTTVTGAHTAASSFAVKVVETINHATNAVRATWSKASAITTARTGGIVTAIAAELVGLAGDTSGATYAAFHGLAPTANGGSAVYAWGYVAAGYTRLLDLTAVATGEAIVALKDNLAVAAAFKEATTSYLSFVTTDGSEAVAAGVRLTTTDAVASGTARVVGGQAKSVVAASTAITGTTETQTVFDQSYTMPANTLKAGTVVRVRAAVFYTATTGAETHALAVMLGATQLAITGNIDPADNGFSVISFEFVCRDAGATGHVVGAGTCSNGARAAALTSTHGLFTGATSTSTQQIDTTGSLVVGIAITRQASATDSDSCRLDYLHVEVIG